jgi:hypothetical protein
MASGPRQAGLLLTARGQKVSLNEVITFRRVCLRQVPGNFARIDVVIDPVATGERYLGVSHSESIYCTNLEGGLPVRRLDDDWVRPPPSRLGAPSTV